MQKSTWENFFFPFLLYHHEDFNYTLCYSVGKNRSHGKSTSFYVYDKNGEKSINWRVEDILWEAVVRGVINIPKLIFMENCLKDQQN
jgi:hypothetical protein